MSGSNEVGVGFDTFHGLTGEAAGEAKRKVFAKPFKLVFKKTADQTLTWITVESLEGLGTVANRIAQGELVALNAMGTLDRQLWGHLAEYAGFLRYENDSNFSDGIQVLSNEQASLLDDMAEISGGFDSGLKTLSDLRKNIMSEMEAKLPVEPTTSHDFVKEDGVNLTSRGEKALADIVGESEIDVESDIALGLTNESEPEPAEDQDADEEKDSASE